MACFFVLFFVFQLFYGYCPIWNILSRNSSHPYSGIVQKYFFHWIIYTYKLKWAKVFDRKWFCFKMSFFAVFCQSGSPTTVPSVSEICGYWEISSTALYRISPLIGSYEIQWNLHFQFRKFQKKIWNILIRNLQKSRTVFLDNVVK